MRKSIIVLSVMMIVTVIIGVVVLPNTVPNTLYNIGRTGVWYSKYCDLFWIFVPVLIGVPTVCYVDKLVNMGHGKSSIMAQMIFADIVLLMLEVYLIMALFNQYGIAIYGNEVVSIKKYGGILVPIVIISLGLCMRLVEPNAIFGIRVAVLMQNKDLWKKVHSVCGIIIAISGVLFGAVVLFNSELFNEGFLLVLVIDTISIIGSIAWALKKGSSEH